MRTLKGAYPNVAGSGLGGGGACLTTTSTVASAPESAFPSRSVAWNLHHMLIIMMTSHNAHAAYRASTWLWHCNSYTYTYTLSGYPDMTTGTDMHPGT